MKATVQYTTFGRKTDQLWIWNKPELTCLALFQINIQSVLRQCAVAIIDEGRITIMDEGRITTMYLRAAVPGTDDTHERKDNHTTDKHYDPKLGLRQEGSKVTIISSGY